MLQDHELKAAKERLLAGGVVAMPTETVYGLAASINSEEGLKKVFSLKERPFFDPLIVHIADLEQKGQVVREWPEAAEILAQEFWPGPLTMVLPKQPQVNSLITSGLDTVGLRMPNHPLARSLIRAVGSPLAAPSANKFGKTSPTKAEHVRKSFAADEVQVLDGGPSDLGLESTVVSIGKREGCALISILRPGVITEDMIRDLFRGKGQAVVVERIASHASPGHTEHHYMPSVPLVILETEAALGKQLLQRIYADFQLMPNTTGAELRLDANPKLAARNLYGRMRECAEGGAEFIFVVHRKEQSGGLWEAIWDRLNRAASRRY